MRTLLSVLARNGFVAPRCLPHAAFALSAAIGRWPFSAVEKVRVGGMMKTAPRMEPPIFIVGHWRSGTTHLYNLLTRSPRFGYVKPFAAGMEPGPGRLGPFHRALGLRVAIRSEVGTRAGAAAAQSAGISTPLSAS